MVSRCNIFVLCCSLNVRFTYLFIERRAFGRDTLVGATSRLLTCR